MSIPWETTAKRTLDARVGFLRALANVCHPSGGMPFPVLLREALCPGWESYSSNEQHERTAVVLREYHLETDWMIRVLLSSVEWWRSHEDHEWNTRLVFYPSEVSPSSEQDAFVTGEGRLFEAHPVDGCRPLPTFVKDDPNTTYVWALIPDPTECLKEEFRQWAARYWDEAAQKTEDATAKGRVKKKDVRRRKIPPEDRPLLLARWQIEKISQTRLARDFNVTRPAIIKCLNKTAKELGIELRPSLSGV